MNHPILFKAQEYLWLTIFEKPNFHWQHQSPVLIGNIKAQFSLAIFKKPNFHWQHQSSILIGNIKAQFSLAIFKSQFSLATSKPNFYWQHQNPILIGNIRAQFSLTIFKTQFTLTLLKAQANYLALFYQNPRDINTWQNTISQLFHLKVQ